MKEMDEAMSSPSAPITGATAAIAELPQIEFPQAIKIESFVGRPSRRLKPKPVPKVTTNREHDGRKQKHARCRNRRKADRGAEQHNSHFEELLRAERYAGLPSLG